MANYPETDIKFIGSTKSSHYRTIAIIIRKVLLTCNKSIQNDMMCTDWFALELCHRTYSSNSNDSISFLSHTK